MNLLILISVTLMIGLMVGFGSLALGFLCTWGDGDDDTLLFVMSWIGTTILSACLITALLIEKGYLVFQ